MKILVADDHSVVRKGLIQIVKEMPEVAEVEEAVNGLEVLDKVKSTEFDLIVLDISMPDKSGLDVLIELKNYYGNLPVLILSTYPEELYAIRALKAGASGYLNKSTAAEELAFAIRRVAKGEKYVSTTLAEKLAFSFGEDKSKLPHEKLSDREFQVLLLIASGKSLSQIAESLFLSSKTISTYRARILEKMDLTNNAEITNYAIKNNLVE
ncbi:hypothetical protein MNBD_IGNAVI01-3215 [hydrothermal vent metagenome]|uniref:Two-component transcriptional response regulator, LuxR family n=1 Tax=hydrothermal vent metagenome TaxID=652676 RepID=A0A3B1C1T5_9ZZZZ